MTADRAHTSRERELKAIVVFYGIERVARRVERHNVESQSRYENVGVNFGCSGLPM